MSDDFHFRQAETRDAEAFVALIRRAFAPERIGLTIYGAPGIATFIADQLESRSAQSARRYMVAEAESRIVGAAELTTSDAEVFLGYIAVDETLRSRRIATKLLAASIAAVRRSTQTQFVLDVFSDNVVARRWYEGLGMAPDARPSSDWWQLPLAAPDSLSSLLATEPLDESDERYARYGFSEIVVLSDAKRYTIGLLGDRYFRCTNAAAVFDAALIRTLGAIDSSRQLLIHSLDPALDLERLGARRLFSSVRLRAPLDEIERRLAAAAHHDG